MCRVLAVKAEQPFACEPHLRAFADVARTSPEYQGHGWGCARLDKNGLWMLHHDIRPIWECPLDRFGETRLLIAHARSAFRNEGITVENNMPFSDGRHVFAFNGELHGVRMREPGRIGAEKIFNFIRRFHPDEPGARLADAVEVIARRTRYVRAMNIIMSDGSNVCVSTQFNEDAAYFTMHVKESAGCIAVCSAPYPDDHGWSAIPNHTTRIWT